MTVTPAEILGDYDRAIYQLDIEDSFQVSRDFLDYLQGRDLTAQESESLQKFFLLLPTEVASDFWVGLFDLSQRNKSLHRVLKNWYYDPKVRDKVGSFHG